MVAFQYFLEPKSYSRTSENYNGMLHLYDKNNIWQQTKNYYYFYNFENQNTKKKINELVLL